MDDGQINMRFNNRDPVYLQVVRYFKEELATGRLAAGDVIPSRREIAGLLKINPNTAQKAYKEMEDQSLILTEGNSPSRITHNEQLISSIRSELIQEAVAAFIDSIRKIDMPVEELLDAVRQQYMSGREETGEED
ncbi:GntR family transcriptional regulator [Paenibacillus nasutitermitis]|uniref:GntR family transcriptional regulator n=1 Tax=Paenibacillus nasutitermitis TaxID=1652958 RepID=A0A916Z130_9BACL|nr:GntR family transcriptional regulator [Paenibacillus nasutitermitis]